MLDGCCGGVTLAIVLGLPLVVIFLPMVSIAIVAVLVWRNRDVS